MSYMRDKPIGDRYACTTVRVSASFQKIPPQGSSKKGAYDLGAVVRGVDLLPPVAQYNNNNNNNRVKKKKNNNNNNKLKKK